MPISISPNSLIIFDTTLRDGEQSPGASMTPEEKLQIALMLEKLKVDVMEVGFPASSQGDFDSVETIAGTIRTSIVCGLARASENDIRRAAAALKQAEQGRIHTFISTSPLHMDYKLKKTPEQVLQMVTDSVTLARNLCGDVEWSAEDASRTEPDFLCRCVEAAIKAGARTINIPDTVGYSTPQEYADIFRMLIRRVPTIDKAILSTHCHNDLGLATANSLAGILGGARQVECTINGLGERAGNAALEEIVMALRTRQDIMPFTTGIVTRHLLKASRLVSSITGFPMQPNKAIVGINAFAHEAGIHQAGMLKDRRTYEIMTPESVGVAKTTLPLSKSSGTTAFRVKLEELGYTLDTKYFDKAFARFKTLADRKKEVYDEDIMVLVDAEAARVQTLFRFVDLEVTMSSKKPPQVTLSIEIDKCLHTATATGDGTLDALFKAIDKLIPHQACLQFYQATALTRETDAQATVMVRLQEKDYVVTGHSTGSDTIEASACAYINALNRLAVNRLRIHPTVGSITFA